MQVWLQGRSSSAARSRTALWRRFLAVGLIAVGAFVALTTAWALSYAVLNPPVTWLMLEERARLGRIEQRWAPLEAIPAHVRRSAIAAEDARFCAHGGVDVVALREAISDAQAGGFLRGASTITQQTAKNAFLWADRSYLRKGLELWFAGLIEVGWGKPRILEVYLNVAEFGPGVFGVSMAAKNSFGGALQGLSEAQAARLIAALPSPRRRDPAALSLEHLDRARSIEIGADDLALTGRAGCVLG